MRTMYDAVTARNILGHDETPEMVAGYVDRIKLAPWTDADWALFPGAVKVEIVKKASSNFGDVLDVEPGDATPSEAPGWVKMRRAAGADPTVYMNASTWPAVRAEFARQQVAPPHYWVAKYDKDPAWPAGWAELGCVAKQHTGDFRGVDISSVADFWPGVDGARPASREDDEDMGFGRVCPAGTDQHADIAVVDCEKLRIHCSWGDQVIVRGIVFHADTNEPGPGGGYMGFQKTPPETWRWDSDRPGPLTIPDGATTCTVRYDAKHDFFLSAAKS